MSNTTVNVRQAAEDARMVELRRQQEAERQARIERALSQEARHQIRQQEDRFRAVQAQLDGAKARLPDLAFHRSFEWPNPPGERADSARLKAYVARVRQQIDEFEGSVTRAVEHAEYQLRRREATAQTWRASQDARTQLRLNQQAMADLCQRLGQPPSAETRVPSPPRSAELETVQTYVADLQAALDAQSGQLLLLRAEAHNLRRAGELAGAAMGPVQGAEVALAAHSAEAATLAHERFDVSLKAAKVAHGMGNDNLPPGLQRLVDSARQMAAEKDWNTTLHDWLAREATRRRDVVRARAMLASPPEGIHESEGLAYRWQQLVPRLQAVMAGHEHLGSDLESEVGQLRRDAQRHLNYLLSRAECFAKLASQGMEVLEREDGQGLVVIDLTRPDTWLEVMEFAGEEGQFAASFELKTDAAPDSLDDESQTASICERLKQATSDTGDKVRSESEVVERKSRITRARKPTLKSRSLPF
jgi:hypothetical protein